MFMFNLRLANVEGDVDDEMLDIRRVQKLELETLDFAPPP
jgi:hypothetical protein